MVLLLIIDNIYYPLTTVTINIAFLRLHEHLRIFLLFLYILTGDLFTLIFFF